MQHRERAPAKINLGLHVLRRRSDGYHDVETVLHRIDWADTVTAEPADTLSLTCSDPDLPTNEENLCLQAAERLATVFGVEEGAALHLDKKVPYGAGLGGGSSDAAATLRLLSRLWDLEATPEKLHAIARTIGSDVPFFLREAPAAYATGRGDALSPVCEGDPYRLPFPLLVAVPPVEIPTPWAYGQVTPNDRDRPALRSLVCTNDLSLWREGLTNDFEAPILAAEPAVADLHQALVDSGARYTSLSGSGSAVYGVFDEVTTARTARDRAKLDRVEVHLQLPT